MYEQLKGDILFCMFYAAVAVLPLVAGFYLWFRRANAFAPQITSPVRLRRWMAAFFACLTLSHVWYIPILFQSSKEEALTTYLIGGLLDSLTVSTALARCCIDVAGYWRFDMEYCQL